MLSAIKQWILRGIMNVVRAVQIRIAHDIEYELRLRARQTSADYFEMHLRGVPAYESKYDLISAAIAKADSDGLFLEFGVYKGSSINFLAEQAGATTDIHGFDSFEGLPENWRPGYPKDVFKLGAAPVVRKNVVLHKGWFEDTLPSFVETNRSHVSFLHVDCDLYSSTRTIFTHLGDRLRPGTVIVFDEYFNYADWQAGEFKAFQEFVSEREKAYQYIGYVRNNEQVAVRIV